MSLLNLFKQSFGYPVRSKFNRDNWQKIENYSNDLQAQIDTLTTPPTGSEVTNARDYYDVLRDNVRARKVFGDYIEEGGVIQAQATPDMTVRLGYISAVINGIGVKKGYGSWSRSGATVTVTEAAHGLSNSDKIFVAVSSDTDPLPLQEYTVSNVSTDTFDVTGVDTGDASGTCKFDRYSTTITAPTNDRYDVVAFNSDNTFTIENGNDSADPILPGLTAYDQIPLARIDLTSATATITSSELTDIRGQGCRFFLDGRVAWEFKIDDAVQAISAGIIRVAPGDYFEEVDLSGLSDIELQYDKGAKHYRPDDASYCIKSVNSGGSETTGIKITGGAFYGNGKAGTIELLKITYTDEVEIIGCRFDGNNSSTATYKNWIIDNADNFVLNNNLNLDNSGDIDYTTTNLTNVENYMEDGYYKNQITFCGVTAQKAQMIKQGWAELTAMDDKFLRIDKDAAGATGGNDTANLEHNHQYWSDPGGANIAQTWQSNGSTLQNFGYSSAASGTLAFPELIYNDTNYYTKNAGDTSSDNKPAYYTLIALIHR